MVPVYCGLSITFVQTVTVFILSLYCAGIINNSVNSLFTYQIYKNWNSFYVPNFTPIYEPTGADPELEELCEGDRFCLFDVAVTGRRDIGLSTLDSSRNVEQIIQQSLPGWGLLTLL